LFDLETAGLFDLLTAGGPAPPLGPLGGLLDRLTMGLEDRDTEGGASPPPEDPVDGRLPPGLAPRDTAGGAAAG